MLSVEGARQTLREERVLIPGTSVLLNRHLLPPGFCSNPASPAQRTCRTGQPGTPRASSRPNAFLRWFVEHCLLRVLPVKSFSWHTGGWISSKYQIDTYHVGPITNLYTTNSAHRRFSLGVYRMRYIIREKICIGVLGGPGLSILINSSFSRPNVSHLGNLS